MEEVQKAYSDLMEKERAYQSLEAYRLGGQPMHTFLGQFESLAQKANYFGEDTYLISFLKPACDRHLVSYHIMRKSSYYIQSIEGSIDQSRRNQKRS
jgi:hypothetical protein